MKQQLIMENCTSDCKQNYILYLPQDQAACESSKADTLPLGSSCWSGLLSPQDIIRLDALDKLETIDNCY